MSTQAQRTWLLAAQAWDRVATKAWESAQAEMFEGTSVIEQLKAEAHALECRARASEQIPSGDTVNINT